MPKSSNVIFAVISEINNNNNKGHISYTKLGQEVLKKKKVKQKISTVISIWSLLIYIAQSQALPKPETRMTGVFGTGITDVQRLF